ncbi:RNase III domain-containing protein [Pyricularia oryzae Y34]|uniref:RNase III domain-containing protein n=2 Tax=Pyricularia oryzae TaxID=318829 RepID=A0AA97NMX6_PYRO3|nr:RNase III domain-containing protein [Pyricularia oryzae Y34]
MAFNSARCGLSTSTRVLRRCSAPLLSRPFSQSLARQVTTAAEVADEQPVNSNLPRWAKTPERMKSTVPLGEMRNPSNRQFYQVNESQARLDQFYNSFLGRDGEMMLGDEAKWLSVTHKSYDQGRRGFNSRLALHVQRAEPSTEDVVETRQPFEHPALARVNNLAHVNYRDIVDQVKLARLGMEYGLHEVVRWQPRAISSINSSGMQKVMKDCIYAIIGAISMQHGAEVARRVCRERVIKKVRGD